MILFWTCLLALQTKTARGEPVVEIVSQDNTITAPQDAGTNWLPYIPIHMNLSADGGYDDNVISGHGQQGSLFTRENASVSYDLPEGRTQIHLLAGAGFTYFFDAGNTRTNDVDTHLTLSLTHQISERLSFAANIYATYQTEPDFSSNVGPENVRANFFHTADSLSVTYHWLLRFATVTSYNFGLIKYDGSSIGMLQDRVEDTLGEQFQFSLSQRTNLVAEYRFEVIDYDTAPRDSITHFVLAGVDHSFTEQLTLHVRAGETFRSYKDDGDHADPYFEGSLIYANTERSSLSWTMNYGVEEPNTPGVLLRKTFRTGLQLRYGLSARISSTAAIYYHHDENDVGTSSSGSGSGFSQDSVDVSLGLAYKINNHLSFHLGLDRYEVTSAGAIPDYSRNRYFAGLSLFY
jgi:hypothetical protein